MMDVTELLYNNYFKIQSPHSGLLLTAPGAMPAHSYRGMHLWE